MKMRIAGIGAICLVLAGCARHEEATPEVVVRVKTTRARLAPVEETVTAPANLIPRAETQVAARITAPIERLGARKGEFVRRGQVLAYLVDRDIRAQLDQARAQLAEARASLEKIVSAQTPEAVKRAQANLASTEAALAEAEKIYQQRQKLFAEGAIPERELLLSKTRYEQAKADHEVAKTALEVLLKSSREQDLRVARARVEQAQAQVAYFEAQLEFTRVRSPYDGVVTGQLAYPGDMARPDSPLFTVMDVSAVIASAQVPVEQVAAIRRGQRCWFEPVDSSGHRYEGRVEVVNQAADPARRTVEVWCEIPNALRQLRPGEFGTCGIVVSVHPRALVVPLAAVQFEEGKSQGVVWVVTKEQTAQARRVATGVVTRELVEIRQGLQPGETVIEEGAYGLSDGMRVSPMERQPKETPPR